MPPLGGFSSAVLETTRRSVRSAASSARGMNLAAKLLRGSDAASAERFEAGISSPQCGRSAGNER